jgi:hypothetical protein
MMELEDTKIFLFLFGGREATQDNIKFQTCQSKSKHVKNQSYPRRQETNCQEEVPKDLWHAKERSQEGCQEGILCHCKGPQTKSKGLQ